MSVKRMKVMKPNRRTPPKVEALNMQHSTELKNQQQQEKIESIFFFFCREEAKGRSKF